VAYTIEFTAAAYKDFTALPKQAQAHIDAALQLLKQNPRPPKAKHLKGQWRGYCRIRTGDYRVIYAIEDRRLVICVVRIGSRGDVYR
jgi:mRNA interferase RelE/StbE